MSSRTSQGLSRDFVEKSEVTTAPERKQKRGAATKHRPDGKCEAPGCDNLVQGGMVHTRVERYFCSHFCKLKAYRLSFVIGMCKHCNGPIHGRKAMNGLAHFCSIKCKTVSYREGILSPTGPFRDLIVEYVSVAPSYKKATIPSVRTGLCNFLRHVVVVEKISTLEKISPRMVTRFLKAEEERGMTSSNAVSHVATFFNWLIAEERFEKRNPVVPRIHFSNINFRTRQPYSETQIASLWRILQDSGSLPMKLMFSIGEECGLRNGEVCNIRLSDIDAVKQIIHVRLPTKNGEERDVHFHRKVTKYLDEWLNERNTCCKHDHLFHNLRLRPVRPPRLDHWFKALFGKHPEPAVSFEFHRLRHTWATRLVNAGMELPVLQQLGGWKSAKSVQIYAKIYKSTVERQYAAAYAVMEEKQESPEEESLSLLDFALTPDERPPTNPKSTV